jgi:tRNA-splicing ligase RtcB (3'-phosphate/5'-hydroxy nucleic acid ligase)
MTDRTLAVIREPAVAARQVGHIRRHLETAGFKIIAQSKVRPEGAEAEAFVASINATGGSALLLERDYATTIWRTLIHVIQNKDAEHLPADSLYGPEPENAATEIGHLFPKYRPTPAIVGQEPKFANSPLVTFGDPDERTLQQIHTCMAVGNVAGGVLCADAHVGYAQPVGGVVAYDNMISISGVGFDEACGNAAVKTNIPFGAVKHRIMPLLKDISRKVTFGLGRTSNKAFDHPLLDDVGAWQDADVEHLRSLAQSQFLTCGTSNHYVDLFYEVPDSPESDVDKQSVWIGVHFGSRGLGFKTTTKYLKAAGGKEGMFIAPTVLRADSELGQRYIAAMQLCGRYAYANRQAVLDEIRRIMGAREVEITHNNHNFAWLEEHGDRKLWVVRKGATPAFPGQRGFIGGSMGDDAVIIEGVDSEKSRAAFYSTIHGAGRIMSRTEAKRTFTRNQMEAWLHDRGVTLLGAGVDESPMSYRRLDDVLKHHEGTIRIIHRLRPFAVMMADDSERRRDPYHE